MNLKLFKGLKPLAGGVNDLNSAFGGYVGNYIAIPGTLLKSTRNQITAAISVNIPLLNPGEWCIAERNTLAGSVTLVRPGSSVTIDGNTQDFVMDTDKVAILISCQVPNAYTTRLVDQLPSTTGGAASAGGTFIVFEYEYLAAGTYVIPLPAATYSWEAFIIGGGGSGSVRGSMSALENCTGGGGASYGHCIRKMSTGATALTLVLGAGGASVTGGSNGNPGASSTCSDGTITLTAPGGLGGITSGGNAAGAGASLPATINDAGLVDSYIGPGSGASNAVSTSTGSTGGGSPGGPWGNGQLSGTINPAGATTVATGGASPTFPSSSTTGGATIGAGLGGSGGGGMGPGGAGIPGWSATMARSVGPLILQNAYGIFVNTGTSSPAFDGAGGNTNGVSGGLKGGGGGVAGTGANNTAGDGGMFAGGGGAANGGANTATAGKGNGGGGGGAGNSWSGGGVSGKGGDGYGYVRVYVKQP